MNKKYFYSLMAVFCMNFAGQAQNLYDEIIFNGNVCRGYISSQNMQTGDIEFEAMLQTATINAELVSGKTVEKKNYNELSEPAQKWLEENPRFIKHEGDDTFVYLTKLETIHNSSNIGSSIIIEDGPIIKYVMLDHTKKLFKSTDIETIKRFERPEDQASGLCDVIVSEGKEYEGQILEKRIGKEIRLLKNDGIVQVIGMKKIQSIGKKPLNSNRGLLEQSPFLETIITKSGQELRGLITKESYKTENGKYETTLYVTTEKGNIESVAYKDVSRLTREINANYKVEKYKVVENDEFMVCGQVAPKCTSSVFDHDILYVNEEDETFSICKINSSQNTELIVDMEDTSANRNIILIPLTTRKSKRFEYYTFSDSDLLNKEIEPSSITTLRGVKTLHYDMPKAGFYLLYRKSDKRIHCVKVFKD